MNTVQLKLLLLVRGTSFKGLLIRGWMARTGIHNVLCCDILHTPHNAHEASKNLENTVTEPVSSLSLALKTPYSQGNDHQYISTNLHRNPVGFSV